MQVSLSVAKLPMGFFFNWAYERRGRVRSLGVTGFMRVPGRGKANLGMPEKAIFPEKKETLNHLGQGLELSWEGGLHGAWQG